MKRIELPYNSINQTVFSPTEDTEYIVIYDPDGGLSEQGKRLLTVKLEKSHVSCSILCACRVGHGQVFDLATFVIHTAAHTTSLTRVKIVLDDGGESRYVGKVVVEKTARGSDSRLEERTLILGDGVRNHAEPIMRLPALVFARCSQET